MEYKEMLPIVSDKNFIKLGIIDDYKSFIWTSRYYVHGDFELTTGVTPKNIELLKVGNYITRDDDDNIGIIESVGIDITETNEETLIISGRFATQILSRRIIASQTQVNGKVTNAIYSLINDAIINPRIAERKINNFIIGSYTNNAKLNAQYTGKNLYEVVSAICLQYGLGLKVNLDNSNNFVFNLYEGTDRSYNQSANPYIVFSDVYDNLLNAQFQTNAQNLVTNVLAAGEGEGDARKMIWVSNGNPTALDRYEFFDDSRNISSNEGEISETEYMSQLAESGKANLTSYETKFAGQVNFDNVKYKQDVFLGDICTIENSKLNKAFNSRIIEIIESIDESGKYSIIPTFGT